MSQTLPINVKLRAFLNWNKVKNSVTVVQEYIFCKLVLKISIRTLLLYQVGTHSSQISTASLSSRVSDAPQIPLGLRPLQNLQMLLTVLLLVLLLQVIVLLKTTSLFTGLTEGNWSLHGPASPEHSPVSKA